eukprot:Sdes_comp19054_c0_seq1m9647
MKFLSRCDISSNFIHSLHWEMFSGSSNFIALGTLLFWPQKPPLSPFFAQLYHETRSSSKSLFIFLAKQAVHSRSEPISPPHRQPLPPPPPPSSTTISSSSSS